jgi:hypothetical protein
LASSLKAPAPRDSNDSHNVISSKVHKNQRAVLATSVVDGTVIEDSSECGNSLLKPDIKVTSAKTKI